MLVIRAKKLKKESCPWRKCVTVENLLRTLLWVSISPCIQQRGKSPTIRAQMGNRLQTKLHVENSFSPSYCSLKLLKKMTKPMAKDNQSFLLRYKGIVTWVCKRLRISEQRYKNMLDGNCFLRKGKTFVGKSSRSNWMNKRFSGDIWHMQKVHKEWKNLLINKNCRTALRIDELKWSLHRVKTRKQSSTTKTKKKAWEKEKDHGVSHVPHEIQDETDFKENIRIALLLLSSPNTLLQFLRRVMLRV